MSREVSEKGMQLKDFLRTHTDVYTLVWFMDEKDQYLGGTYTDPEGAFLHSLHPDLITKKVEKYFFVGVSWSKYPVLIIYIS